MIFYQLLLQKKYLRQECVCVCVCVYIHEGVLFFKKIIFILKYNFYHPFNFE